MPKTYTVGNTDVADDQKTIEIAEPVTETKTQRTSIGQLRQEHKDILEQISSLGERADAIADELNGIKANTNLPVDNIPEKVVGAPGSKPTVPPGKA